MMILSSRTKLINTAAESSAQQRVAWFPVSFFFCFVLVRMGEIIRSVPERCKERAQGEGVEAIAADI